MSSMHDLSVVCVVDGWTDQQHKMDWYGSGCGSICHTVHASQQLNQCTLSISINRSLMCVRTLHVVCQPHFYTNFMYNVGHV
jgi:hypothetical protein